MIGAFSIATFWVLRSGTPWRDLAGIYGPTPLARFVRVRRAALWDGIMQVLTAAWDAAVQMIDTSMVRVHQHAACTADSATRAVGQSRGGANKRHRAYIFALWTAIVRRIAVEQLLNPLQINFDLEATALLREQHK